MLLVPFIVVLYACCIRWSALVGSIILMLVSPEVLLFYLLVAFVGLHWLHL